jgi:phosphopantothenoylcysteine decarboxylase/phosphopantothenate--cysteine ligase
VFIVLGVTGCIGAYKSVELIRRFQDRGHDVQVVATRHALKFITPLTLETISRHPLVAAMFGRAGDWEVEHIALARRSAVLCVAPATANILAKFARGIADDFLSTFYLGTQTPVVVAPAMNFAMWGHAATQANVAVLRERGVTVVEPGSGWLACGETGAGRLAELGRIVEAVECAVTPKSLAGRVVLVTAGPTAEDLDPVRFVTNRASGKMGLAVARMAARRGAAVALVAGPGVAGADFPCERVDVRSAAQMAEAVRQHAPMADAVVMTAAVADYTAAEVSPRKLKKGLGALSLELVRTTDILAELGGSRRPGQVIVGFAAETEDVTENALRKMQAKGADLMVANRVGPDRGFGADVHTATILRRQGVPVEVENQTKEIIATRLLDEIEAVLAAQANR